MTLEQNLSRRQTPCQAHIKVTRTLNFGWISSSAEMIRGFRNLEDRDFMTIIKKNPYSPEPVLIWFDNSMLFRKWKLLQRRPDMNKKASLVVVNQCCSSDIKHISAIIIMISSLSKLSKDRSVRGWICVFGGFILCLSFSADFRWEKLTHLQHWNI